jgi:hypothetical protein
MLSSGMFDVHVLPTPIVVARCANFFNMPSFFVRPLEHFVKIRCSILILAVTVIALLAVAFGVFCFIAQRRADSSICQSGITSMCLAARLWADEHDGLMPTNFICFSDELATPKILICRGDHLQQPASNWATFTTNNCSYEILAPGLRLGDTNTPFLRCTVHGHLGYSDSTVYDGVRRHGKFD